MPLRRGPSTPPPSSPHHPPLFLTITLQMSSNNNSNNNNNNNNNNADEMNWDANEIPKDATIISLILQSMGLSEDEFEPRVVNQLMEFMYRYPLYTCTIKILLHMTNSYGVHALIHHEYHPYIPAPSYIHFIYFVYIYIPYIFINITSYNIVFHMSSTSVIITTINNVHFNYIIIMHVMISYQHVFFYKYLDTLQKFCKMDKCTWSMQARPPWIFLMYVLPFSLV